MNETQQLLAEYAKNGSEAAFREIVQRYVGLVYGTAMRRTNRDHHLAQDVTQTVFASLARTARTLSKGTKLGGRLHRHTCFVAAKAMRSERRRRDYEGKAAEMSAMPDHTAANLSSAARELDEAINGLGNTDRIAILLRFFEQFDFREVGEGLGVSEEAARKRVTRALEKLHVRLSRKGTILTVAALGTLLAGETSPAAPAGLAATVSNHALEVAHANGGGLASSNLMTKLRPLLICGVAVVLVSALLALRHRTTKNVPPQKEVPKISYNFSGIPVSALFSVYEQLCGKKLVVDPNVNLSQTIKILTEHRLTTNEAMRLIEETLKEQAHTAIVAGNDGTLSVIPLSPH